MLILYSGDSAAMDKTNGHKPAHVDTSMMEAVMPPEW